MICVSDNETTNNYLRRIAMRLYNKMQNKNKSI